MVGLLAKRAATDVTLKKRPFWQNIKIVPYLYILPNMILFMAFMIIPLIMTGYYSLVKWKELGNPKFVGLDNFKKILTDQIFLTSLQNTVKFSVITVPLLMTLALGLAVLLNRKMAARGFFRSALYIPSIISMVAAGMIFIWIFNPQLGLINYLLESAGLTRIDWLNDPRFAMIMIVAGTLWSRVGYNMVIYLAGLQGISSDYFEAATIDGASGWQKFLYITFPLLQSTHVFILITCIIYSFKTFDLIYIMTKGGPLNATKPLVVYIYETAFLKNNYGPASASGVILFVILFLFTLFRYKFQKEES